MGVFTWLKRAKDRLAGRIENELFFPLLLATQGTHKRAGRLLKGIGNELLYVFSPSIKKARVLRV